MRSNLEDVITGAMLQAYFAGQGDGRHELNVGISSLPDSMRESLDDILDNGASTIIDGKTLTDLCREAAKIILSSGK